MLYDVDDLSGAARQRHLMNAYTIVIKWSGEDSAYVATVPKLPGCSAIGSTRAEAVAQIEDAIQAWCAAAYAAGNSVPAPECNF